jgi:hypothetical protein
VIYCFLFSDIFDDGDVTLLTLTLQNSGATDSISIVFDNFLITADSLVRMSTKINDSHLTMPSIKLNQNYPNPFNPVTMINYQLPMTNEVDLSIYNILGQKVVTLVNKKQPAGNYKIEWDASRTAFPAARRRAGIASGVYLYQLKAGDYIETRKMILMK